MGVRAGTRTLVKAALLARPGQAGEAFTRESPTLTEPQLDFLSEAELASVLYVVELGAAAGSPPAPHRLPEERRDFRPALPVVVCLNSPARPLEGTRVHG